MAIKLADTARPNNYVDAEHLGTFPVAYADDIWFEDGTRLSEKTFDNGNIQKEELPPASVDELGKIYQYVGETGTYTKGYFYECVSDGATIPTYYWKEAVGGSGYQFSEDFVNEDNNVSLAPTQRIFMGTQAEWDALTTDEKLTYGQVNIIDDESGTPEYYSTTETKTNKVWINGKPIYRKVVPFTATVTSSWVTVDSGSWIGDIDILVYSLLCGYDYNSPSDNTGRTLNNANFRAYGNDLQCSTNTGALSGSKYAILEYTKTTD